MDRNELKAELKRLVIDGLKLEHVTADQIQDNQPIFVEGLGLDSIDALELVVLVEEKYGVAVPDEDVGKQAFQSINSLADFIAASKA